jgi:hypothetical protein
MSRVLGSFYDLVDLRLVTAELPDLELRDGTLAGEDVTVSSRGVAVVDVGGDLIGDRLDPIELRAGALCFDPSGGGVRTRENRRARGTYNAIVAEATCFGMVNAFVHASRVASFFNGLLADLGAPRLPHLPIVVGAHSGSRLPGFAHGDGDFRSGRMRPLAGGHYRLSQRTRVVPEPRPVRSSGEVHLGPGRLRQPFAGHDQYVRAAAHNPATIAHEHGHHLCRHTADFRLNAERKPLQQRNGKPAVEEGLCDYFVAALLSSTIDSWHRGGGRRRDRTHELGTHWAGLWWRCRQRLVAERFLTGQTHDRVMVAMLLALGEVATTRADASHETRAVREARRRASETIAVAYLDALGGEAGPQAVRLARPLMESASDVPAC